MNDAVFDLRADVAHPTELARGPWDPGAQHGGAPAALLAAVLEQRAAPQTIARVTVELLRPVPLAPLQWAVDGSAGRSAGRFTASLTAGGRMVARAHALSCLTAPLDLVEPAGGDGARMALPTDDTPLRIPGMPEQRSFYYTAMEARLASGSVTAPGPSAVWFRLRCPLIAGEPPTPLVRAVAAADFASGTSWVLPFGAYRYVNADLTVYLHRAPTGEWIGVEAETTIDPRGVGVTVTRLFDRDGRVGGAQQTLLVTAPDPAPRASTPELVTQENA